MSRRRLSRYSRATDDRLATLSASALVALRFLLQSRL
jgi:hypothetical protein